MEEDIRLSPEEIRRLVKQDLTDEQVEQLRDFLALYAVITYEGLQEKLRKEKELKEAAQKSI